MPSTVSVENSPRRQINRARQSIIKPEPEPSVNGFSTDHQETTNSISDGASTRLEVRLGRSDAPTPSERFPESGLLLREVRPRPGVTADSPGIEDSFFHTSFSDIGKKLKACNDTLGELQQLGVSHDVQLPELVLVGDQSAGKSSLMSGLANLDLPRSEGTCTRCPLHIRVSRNSDWSCRVWLRKIYEYQPPGREITEADVTNADPFYPWRKRPVIDVHEFKTMHDRTEIEEVLRWAQVAILNDSRPYELFVPGSGTVALAGDIAKAAAEPTTAKFSPNVVALEIKGPDLPDLSFYDMPGIFQNPADERDSYLVNVVRNLSQEYIQHPSAIILCAMPMNTDAENSSTFGLIRRLQATRRTIGVLTKADLLPQGPHGQWLEIMREQTHQVGLGYFITSRLQDKSLDELADWEAQYFGNPSMSEWPRAFHEFEEKCGVENLKLFLSERLGEAFAKSLPTIKHKVKWHLDKIHQQLASLPELPANVELEVQTGLLNFGDKARNSMDVFAKGFGQLPTNFRDCLAGMKPKFGLKDKSDAVITISDDEDSVVSTSSASKRRMVNPRTPNKRARTTVTIGTPSPQPQQGRVKHEDNALIVPPRLPPSFPRRKLFPQPFAPFSKGGSGFRTLRGVKEEIEGKSQAGMPNVTPSEAYNDLAMEAIKPWKAPTEVFLRETMNLIQRELDNTLYTSLGTLEKRFIFRETRKHLKAFLDGHQKITNTSLNLLYGRETEKLYTLNEEVLQRYTLDEKEELTRYRHHLRMEARDGTGEYPPYQSWEELPEEKRAQDAKKREAELLKLGKDIFQREIEVAAYVRAYYRLASSRYADNVTQVIVCDMIPAIRKQLPSYLEEQLGLRGCGSGRDANIYERLMAEDEATASKRETLKSECKKFERALASIRGLESGHTDEPGNGETLGSDITMEDTMQDDDGEV